MEKIEETKSWLFKNIDKTDKTLARWTEKKRMSQITNIRKWSGNIAANSPEINIKYCRQLYTNKLNNLDEMTPRNTKPTMTVLQRNRKHEYNQLAYWISN